MPPFAYSFSPETLLSAAVAFATPLLLAALGECLVERAGVVNIGLEGLMLVAALASVLVSHGSGSPWAGLAAGAGAAVALGLLFGGLAVYRNTDQVVAGMAINLLALGLTGAVYYVVTQQLALQGGSRLAGAPLPEWRVPVLSALPVVGGPLFSANPLVYLAFLLVPATALLLDRTRIGLWLRAVGECPEAAEAAGVSVRRLRLQAILAGAALAGLGGVFLAIGHVATFVENMVAGRGFIALALVLFGRWNPWGVLAGTAVFSLASGLAVDMAKAGRGAPSEVFLLALPYAATLVVLVARRVPSEAGARRDAAPAALGRPYPSG